MASSDTIEVSRYRLPTGYLDGPVVLRSGLQSSSPGRRKLELPDPREWSSATPYLHLLMPSERRSLRQSFSEARCSALALPWYDSGASS